MSIYGNNCLITSILLRWQVSLVIQLANFLTEVLQGPNLANQELLVTADLTRYLMKSIVACNFDLDRDAYEVVLETCPQLLPVVRGNGGADTEELGNLAPIQNVMLLKCELNSDTPHSHIWTYNPRFSSSTGAS
jgi:hypothetical protein